MVSMALFMCMFRLGEFTFVGFWSLCVDAVFAIVWPCVPAFTVAVMVGLN